jgi:uncharacterized membrane protein
VKHFQLLLLLLGPAGMEASPVSYPVFYVWHDGLIATMPYYTSNGATFEPATDHSINDAGDVAGTIFAPLRSAASWNGSTVTAFGSLPGYRESFANDINNRGVLVGASVSGAAWETMEPTEWSGSQIIDLGLAPGFSEGMADAINNAGQIVGLQFTPWGEEAATLWDKGKVTPLTSPARYSEAIAINDSGVAVGGLNSQPVAWVNGVMSALPCSAGGNAYDVNNSGMAVGICGNDAVLWDVATGAITDLGPGLAQGINNSGVVVGRTGSDVYNPLVNQTFVWSANGGMQILPGFAWSEPFAINDSGTIIGYGQLLSDANTAPESDPGTPVVSNSGNNGTDPAPDIPEPEDLPVLGLLTLTGYGLVRRFWLGRGLHAS